MLIIGNLIYGLCNSTILALMALGFTLTFGISGVANFAYGAFYVLAAYSTWILFTHLSFPYILSVVVSILFSGILGGLMYRFILLRVRGQIISEVIVTFGIGLVIMESLRHFAGGFGHNIPVFIDRSFSIANTYLDMQRIMIIILCAILVLSLWLFTRYTRIGLAFRGIAQDERTSLSLGINSDWMATLSVSLGAVLAGIAAIAIFPLGTITIVSGYDVLINALAVCIIGGLGSTTGVILASLLIGFAQKFTDFYIGSHWTMVVSLAAILLILLFRPSGLLGKQKELEERI